MVAVVVSRGFGHCNLAQITSAHCGKLRTKRGSVAPSVHTEAADALVKQTIMSPVLEVGGVDV